MNTITDPQTELERKTARLQASINEALTSDNYSLKIKRNGIHLSGARVNTDDAIDERMIMRLIELLPKHGFNKLEIARSGSGLRILLIK